MSSVEQIETVEALAELRSTWRSLLAQTPAATFFQSLEWLETYWRHYGRDQRLRVLVVRDGDETTGIVPLTILREPTKVGRLRVLTYPQAYWGSFYGPIGRQPREALRAALDHIQRSRRDWDLLDLRFAPPSELDPAASEAELRAAGLSVESRETDRTAFIDLPATMEEYLASRTAKWRMDGRRRQRRLEERGEVRYERYRPRGDELGDGDPRWDLYADCETVAQKSWQGSSTDGTTITHPSIRPFLRDMHRTASAAGAADVNLLYLNDRPIAFYYAYHFQGSIFGLRTGFDAEASRDGAGHLMYRHVIADSIRRGDRLLDLGPGSLDVKRHLYTRVVPIYRRTYGNPFSLRGLLWRAKRTWDARHETVGDGEESGYRNSNQSPTPVTISDTIQAAV